MKKQLLSIALLALGTLTLTAQTAAYDSVLIGSANEAWYKISDGTSSTQPRANWDLAFTTEGFDVTILFNHAGGNNVYIATGATPATFTSVTQADTSATPLYNTDSTWAVGALNKQPSGSYNYGWGSYNTTTHNITGNRVFIVKYSNNTFKKFYIQDLNNSTTPYVYTLVFSNIDNSNQQTVTIPKQTYGTKNFIYYSFTGGLLDREPASVNWDLLFTKYTSTTELYSGYANQIVTGVLQNDGVKAAQANSITAPSTYTTYGAHQFSTNTNIIGWDWKGLNYATFQYTMEPGRVYFVQPKDNSIYKIVFVSFTGSSAGKFKFTKELLASATAIDELGNVIATVSLYPNPVNGDNATLLFSTTRQVSNASVSITDVTGKLVSTEELSVSTGLNQHTLNTSNLNSGVYFIRVNADGYSTTQKLIKQ